MRHSSTGMRERSSSGSSSPSQVALTAWPSRSGAKASMSRTCAASVIALLAASLPQPQQSNERGVRASSALSTSPQCSVSGSPAARAAASAGCHVAKAPSVGLPDRSTPTTPRPRSAAASATVSSAAAQSAHRSKCIRSARLRCSLRAAAARAFTAVDRQDEAHSDVAAAIAATRAAWRRIDSCPAPRRAAQHECRGATLQASPQQGHMPRNTAST